MAFRRVKKRIPVKNDEDSGSVDYPDEISDREIMKNLVKVIDITASQSSPPAPLCLRQP
jgi:hypothetical protein